MAFGSEHDAVRAVVVDYLEGMVWGDEEKLRRAFHPGALQVGHFAETYEFFPLEEFIQWIRDEETQPAGSTYVAELLAIEVTGTVAVAKVTDSCFGTDFTDYLVLVKDRPTPDGRWQIVTKAYHVHAGRGLPRR
ncbi:nuclear transport factor 2 family protein [Rhodobacteraceae bacterium HSP-20]|uniref:Nuclear transport factor 2 family protein n=1 Tax=Paragemmobacter amnigenus TaxID=2852097 RepID=A0ABS6J4I1_9RHOB|nr:nuclear transport factor 2 family protein [Rhodobacter amnigenus]MBU9698422.1 nuclear transport factor 2 family protein [Rhodobacter amnigenus]MBV4389649.1 nuclear transport factor 2 family protein [Rhodobacter amnigenus]